MTTNRSPCSAAIILRDRLAAVLVAVAVVLSAPTIASAERFDFDSAPIHASLPLEQTVGVVTAHFSATGAGFSIQPADKPGFTPEGFGGLCLYPNGLFASDLIVVFDQALTEFSILYAPREVACDSSATLRVTAYRGAMLVASSLATAPIPGTWPTGRLALHSAFAFNRVVVHYEHGPGSGDWGPVFMVDNMDVSQATEALGAIAPDAPRVSQPGMRMLEWDGCDDAGFPVRNATYFCRVEAPAGSRVTRMVLRR